ncbi:type II secretion system F family protein [Desulfurobacterium sp.]|uniref:type II secretion system F family protein n=1 Tax=Desulfurobacterium sp. TaxID=2004706 RepID=UPI002616EF87|nr:type II secretion system F family protein [Desulfurobacterium sp.]
MKVYLYEGRRKNGELVKGKIEAINLGEARNKLKKEGIVFITKLEESNSIIDRLGQISIGGGLTLEDRARILRNLAVLLHAGVKLEEAFEILLEQADKKREKEILEYIINDLIYEGKTLSEAMSRFKSDFGRLTIEMIRSAEETGELAETLEKLADYYDKIIKLRRKVKSAMMYPTVIIFAVILIVAGIIYFVVPQFAQMYKDMGSQLPTPTLLLLNASKFVTSKGPYVVVGFVLFVVGFMQLLKIPAVKKIWDRIMLKVPVLGDIILKSNLAAFSRTFASLFSSGVDIVSSVKTASRTVSNLYIREILEGVIPYLSEGKTMAEYFEKYKKTLDPLFVHMLKTGEASGTIDTMLLKVAENYEDEVDKKVEGLTTLIEPVMIIVIGGVVGGIIVALYLPIFKMGSLVSQ